MKIVLVNYATENYLKKQRQSTLSAKLFGGFSEIFSYSNKDIPSDYFNKNIHILEKEKGAGLWLWKPYFLSNVLERLNYGDLLFHCDSASIFIRNVQPMINSLNLSNQEFMFFDLPLLESEWTKPSLISYFFNDLNYVDTNQISASFFVIKKTKKSESFIKEWLGLCENINLIDNYESNKVYNGHRFDQSILSLLVKKYKLPTFRDPSQYGEFPEMYRAHSKLVTKTYSNSFFKTSIVLLRNSNWIKEVFKYYIKRGLIKLFPRIYFKIIMKSK